MALQKRLILPFILFLMFFGCKSKQEQNEYYEPEQEVYEQSETPVKKDSIATQETPSPALKSYQYSWSEDDAMPSVVIIIDDFGYAAGSLLEDFADLPSEIVFAVLPDLPHTKNSAKLASQKGHEVIIHVPMAATGNPLSPGEKFIKSNMDAESIGSILDDFIAQMPMAIAANNHMGSSTTENYQTMKTVISHLNKNGLFFIDSLTSAKSAVYTASNDLGLFSAKRDIFLDVPDNSDNTIIQKIQSMSKYKGRREPIIVITHCHNRDKLVALKKFIAQIESMGIKIVSLREAFPRARA